MRIGWASPFNKQSPIAGYSLRVCEELKRRGIQASIIRTELGAEASLPALESSLPVYPPAEYTWEFLEAHFDLCVVNASQEEMDKAWIVDLARQFQVVVVFHGQGSRRGKPGTVNIDGEANILGRRDYVTQLASFSTGAIIHDEHDFASVRRLCVGPVVLIPFNSNASEADGASDGKVGLDIIAATSPSKGQGCVEKYVDALIEVLDEALHRAPLRNAGWTIGATVAEMGLTWDDPLSSRLGHEMSALFEEAGGAESDKN